MAHKDAAHNKKNTAFFSLPQRLHMTPGKLVTSFPSVTNCLLLVFKS